MQMRKTYFISLLALCSLFLFSCEKEYSLEGGTAAASTGTLKDSVGACVPPLIMGNYAAGTPMTDSNYIIVGVRVLVPGNYVISTNTQNGISFKDSGFFATTGYRLVQLKAMGTPALAGTSTFTTSLDTSACAFSLLVNPPGSTGGGGGGGNPPVGINDNDSAWQFIENGVFFHGPFTAVTLQTLPPPANVVAFNMAGETFDTGDSTINITVGNRTGANIAVGTYPSNNNSVGSTFNFVDGVPATPVLLYTAGPLVTGANLVFQVTSYSATTKIIEGTFSGTTLNNTGVVKNITNGKFRAQAN